MSLLRSQGGEVFQELASRFRYVPSGNARDPGIPLIKFVNYQSSKEEIARGVFYQSAIPGESAFQIANRIKKAEAGDKKEEAYLKDVLKFKGLEDAKKRINAVENFYRHAHAIAVNFQKVNRLPIMTGRSYTGEEVAQGIDYGNGRNINWDPNEQIFKAFDH